MQKHYNYLDIDLDSKNYRRLRAMQGDIKSRYIRVNLYSNNLAYDLSNCTVKIYGLKRDKTIFFNNAVITNAKLGQFEIELTNQALAVAGELKIQILILGTDGEKLTSSAFFIDVGESIIDENAIESTNEFNVFTQAMKDFQKWDGKFEEKYDGLEAEYAENITELGSQIKDKANITTTNNMQQQINNLVLESGGDSNLEVVQSRGHFNVLNDRFNIIDSFFDIDINLFNSTSNEIIKGNFINEDGVVKPLSETGISHYIKIFPNNTYTCKYYKAMFGSNTIVEFLNSDKIRVSIIKADNTDTTLTFTVPNNSEIVYCRVNLLLNDLNNFVFKYGEDINIKIPTLSDKFGLNENQINLISSYINNPLLKKTVSFNGDSIMYGAGYTGGFAKIIADKNNMSYENIAVSGATISANTTFANDDTNRHWICRTISNMRDDADYIIVEGGVNDKSLKTVNLGVITDGYDDILDDTTFCGALESVCKQLIERFKGKKMGFIITHRIWNMSDVWETSWYPSIIKILKKWGIPYCDLHNSIPSLNLIESLKSQYTKDADGWHPNEEGYRKFYVDKIEAWMKTL